MSLQEIQEEQDEIEPMEKAHKKADNLYKGIDYYLGLGKMVEKNLKKIKD